MAVRRRVLLKLLGWLRRAVLLARWALICLRSIVWVVVLGRQRGRLGGLLHRAMRLLRAVLGTMLLIPLRAGVTALRTGRAILRTWSLRAYISWALGIVASRRSLGRSLGGATVARSMLIRAGRVKVATASLVTASPATRATTTARRALVWRRLRVSVLRILGVVRGRRAARGRWGRRRKLVLLVSSHGSLVAGQLADEQLGAAVCVGVRSLVLVSLALGRGRCVGKACGQRGKVNRCDRIGAEVVVTLMEQKVEMMII